MVCQLMNCPKMKLEYLSEAQSNQSQGIYLHGDIETSYYKCPETNFNIDNMDFQTIPDIKDWKECGKIKV